MAAKLWELSDVYGTVSECYFSKSFYSWKEFIASEEWNHNWISGCKPVHWNWCDKQSEDYESFSGDDGIDYLDLVWLSMAPCRANHIRVDVTKEEEPEVKRWLIEHKFIHGEDV